MRWTRGTGKNEINKRKHAISFETAEEVFSDPLLVMLEEDDSYQERWKTFGAVDSMIVVVAHTWPQYDREVMDTVGRIVSARRATRIERIAYEEGHNTKLTPEQQTGIDALKAMSDDDIDTSDIPEVVDWSNARRGMFHRLEQVCPHP